MAMVFNRKAVQNEQNDFVGKGMNYQHDDPKKDYGNRYRIFYPPHIRKSTCSDVPVSDIWYRMTTYPRGRMLIINMKHFHQSTGLHEFPREGTGTDVEAMVRLFLKLGFIIEVFDDLKKSELLRVMGKASKASYRSYGAFACAILSRGEEGKIVYATDSTVEIRKLSKMFCGPNLAGKPKVFFIHACQGVQHVTVTDDCDGGNKNEECDILTLPSESDFLYAYSTVEGQPSWSDTNTGSWFIQTICKVFREHAKDSDIMRLMTKVNHEVTVQTNGRQQIASVVSQLRKEFYFFPPS